MPDFACSGTSEEYNSSTGFNYYEFSSNCKKIEKSIPDEDYELLPGIKWGNYCQLYTPAFWKFMYLVYESKLNFKEHRIGSNIIEEIVACLLGGYGMPSELGLAAFKRLKENCLIRRSTSYCKIKEALSMPFEMENGLKKYRFYNQKSRYVYRFLQRDDLNCISLKDDLSFRNWLLTVEGIGFKTASWITRNWLQSENVAILDIHIIRAGRIAGFFDENIDVSRKYLDMENNFINFCKALEVLPSNMDAIIWNYMKRTNKLALQVLNNS